MFLRYRVRLELLVERHRFHRVRVRLGLPAQRGRHPGRRWGRYFRGSPTLRDAGHRWWQRQPPLRAAALRRKVRQHFRILDPAHAAAAVRTAVHAAGHALHRVLLGSHVYVFVVRARLKARVLR